MAADSQGYVHIALAGSATGGITYTTNSFGSWYHEQVTSHADRDPSIAVDSDGYVYIAFARTDDVKGIYVASIATGSWVETLRHTGADRSPSIAVRGSHMYLAFKTEANSLMYQSNSSGSWQSKDGRGRMLCRGALTVAQGRYHRGLSRRWATAGCVWSSTARAARPTTTSTT